MFATSILISTQNRLQNTIRVIVLVETFASTWLYKQYYIYHWPRPLGPSADPNYEALSLVMTVPLAIWLTNYEDAQFVEMGRTNLHADPRIRGVRFAIARRSTGAIVMAALAWVNSQHKMRLVVGFVAAVAVMFAIGPTR